MKIKKHVCFRDEENPQLVLYLQNHDIAYDKGEIISSLDIYEHDPHWQHISKFVQSESLLCLSETIFSKKELSSAEWLTIRSQWRNGYPQPEDEFEYEHITYSNSNHCHECGAGLIQVNPFRIKNVPKWGNRHFMMLNWIPDELFVDETVKRVFQCNNVSGVLFGEVHDKKGQYSLPQIYQMNVAGTLPPGITVNNQSIDTVLACSNCGTQKYHPTGIGMHSFRRRSFENAPDIVRTNEVFGWGHSASRLIIVSQKVYQLIVGNKLDKGLVFQPVLLV